MSGILAALIGCEGQAGGGGGGFHVVAAPAAVSSIFAISDPVTATASGGSGTYEYSWSIKSGSGVQITTPAVATTTFSCFGREEKEATAICSVKDTASGNIAVSNDVFVILLINTH